jgi:hypothetical protein
VTTIKISTQNTEKVDILNKRLANLLRKEFRKELRGLDHDKESYKLSHKRIIAETAKPPTVDMLKINLN